MARIKKPAPDTTFTFKVPLVAEPVTVEEVVIDEVVNAVVSDGRVVHDLPDGTRITSHANGDVIVETPTPAPYRNPTS